MGYTNKKCAFHIHTNYSFDSMLNPKEIVDYYVQNDYQIIIITDHNEIEGALASKKYAEEVYKGKIEVVIGEEIKSDIGDLIGFPLKEKIEPGKADEVLKKIKDQGAYVCIPHPYHEHNLFGIHEDKIVSQIDFVEIFNSRLLNQKYNQFAGEYCLQNGKKQIIGADAHLKRELGNASFEWDNDYNLYEMHKKVSSKRNIRITTIIKAVKKKEYKRIPVLILLFILGR